jgi:hypothetical protein
VIATAGSWDPTDRPCYFLAADYSDQQRLAVVEYRYVLFPVNVFASSGADDDVLERFIDAGCRVLLDSGVFILTQNHCRAHGMTMDHALALAPDEIDGFDQLLKDYLRMTKRFGDRLWGYIEMDQGGAANKRTTRRRLEDAGLRPIPVYHPLNDGWDYFDELATTYDRICWGNVVQAKKDVRLRMLATIAERRREYPDLWVHVLGLTPNEWCNALVPDSADSSTWLSAIRWGGYIERSMLAAIPGGFDAEYRYRLGDQDPASPSSDRSALRMAGVGTASMLGGWRHWLSRVSDLGIDHPLSEQGR